jgi:uncharacterized membrane protein YfcA
MAYRHRCAMMDGMAPSRSTAIKAHQSIRDALVQVFWFLAFAALVLTLAIVVVGGTRFLAPSMVKVVIGALLILTSIHLWTQHRHSDERKHDPRLRRDRERRGY